MLDPLPLKGRTAVVTGSGQNIGEAIAKLFLAGGCQCRRKWRIFAREGRTGRR